MWDMIRESLLVGDDIEFYLTGDKADKKKEILETVLNNSFKHSRNAKEFIEIVLPVLRRVVPNLFAHEIIGVHAIKDETDTVRTLRVGYAEPLPPSSPQLFMQPNGTFTCGQPISNGNRLSILTDSVEVTAVKSKSSFISMEDLELETHLLKDELIAALSKNMISDYDEELLKRLIELPGPPTSTFCMDNVTGTPTYVGDVHAALAILINRQANLIAARTRRGAGNRVVVSSTALTILQSATTSAFARTTGGLFETKSSNCSVKYVGTLNNSMHVYCNPYADDETPVLIAYNTNDLKFGNKEVVDAAAAFCPYLPFYFDEEGNGAKMNAYHELQNTIKSLANSADYLGTVGIDVSSLTFT